jgi:cyclopropane fatty-acyl-phospholipid synthase-like methyltransferase
MTADDELRQIAAALDATPELIPYLPDLLADLWDLGSSPSRITEWLRELDLPAETRVLDLGCGKGAVALTLARDLGFTVHGVELFEPFIRDARARTREWGLGGRCLFQKADLRDVVRSATEYDVVIYASVGALGRLDDCVGALRRCVRHRGYIVIDEGVSAPNAAPDPGFENLAPLDESRRRLISHGDEIVREHLLDPGEMRAIDHRYIESIAQRADTLVAAHPEDAELIRGYVDRQERAAAAWERNAVSAAWLLLRAAIDPS